MILASRPLRFLTAVIGGWVGIRAAMLWPVAVDTPRLIRSSAPRATAARPPAPPARSVPSDPTESMVSPVRIAAFVRTRHRPVVRPVATAAVITSSAGAVPELAPIHASSPTDSIVPGVDPPPTFRASRWSGSAWAILRPDGRATPFASQLGGSQAGARVAYAIDRARRVALYARVSTAIDVREREGAVGIDWRPTRLPIHLVAERRIGIEGIRSGLAVGAVGGVGPTRIAGPVRIEGYAQAGVIVRDGHEGFADGSLRLTVPVRGRIDLGLGAWGGAQRGAARLDLGPTIGVTLPVARRAFRLSADWRRRTAGAAKPGSGPAVSLGVDF